jgi:hypothetical protein
MSEIFEIPVKKTIPTVADVLLEQGIRDLKTANERIRKIAEDSTEDYNKYSRPAGIIREISCGDFDIVYRGEGNNESETPLDLIYPASAGLALFAVTIGEDISKKITSYFDEGEFAAGSMLDSAASAGTDLAADYVESFYKKNLSGNRKYYRNMGLMRFSPGYCGWHISGQKKLFEYLQPDKIGIELTDSCLMKPLKSISGVIVIGLKHIFEFEDNFTFCAVCNDHSCVGRIKSLTENK